MSRKTSQLFNPNRAFTGTIADRFQNFVDDMIWRETNLSDRKRAVKAKDKFARKMSARMFLANLHQHWKADPKSTIGIMLTRNWY